MSRWLTLFQAFLLVAFTAAAQQSGPTTPSPDSKPTLMIIPHIHWQRLESCGVSWGGIQTTPTPGGCCVSWVPADLYQGVASIENERYRIGLALRHSELCKQSESQSTNSMEGRLDGFRLGPASPQSG